MFKAVLTNVDLLKNSIPILSEIVDEGVFRVNQNGINLLCPDRSMVAVIDFKLLSSAFDSFSVDSEEHLGLNMANLVSVVKRMKTGDKVVLESSDKGNKLKITIEGNSKRLFELPLLDIKTEKPPIDQLTFPGMVDVESSVIEDGIADADIVSDSIVLEALTDAFRMNSKGDVSSASFEIKKGQPGLGSVNVGGKIKSRYPLEYLKKMIKASKISKNMTLEFGTDYPLRMSFKSLDKMSLQFILAPRVSDE